MNSCITINETEAMAKKKSFCKHNTSWFQKTRATDQDGADLPQGRGRPSLVPREEGPSAESDKNNTHTRQH